MSVVKILNHCSIVPVHQAAPHLTLGSSIHVANAKQRIKKSTRHLPAWCIELGLAAKLYTQMHIHASERRGSMHRSDTQQELSCCAEATFLRQ